jgi:CheY-like chemotaxis protein
MRTETSRSSVPPSLARPALVRMRVLVVDDDPLVLRMYGRLLKMYDSATASSVKEAMARLEETEFDVVVADLAMPDGSGVDIHRWMDRRAGRRPRFVFATGGITCPEDQRYLDEARCPYLLKPFNGLTLRTAIEGAANGR